MVTKALIILEFLFRLHVAWRLQDTTLINVFFSFKWAGLRVIVYRVAEGGRKKSW